MDDMAVSIWTSVLQHTARIWIKKNSLKKKIGEQFKATVRILQMWGGGLSSQILTNDSNFCRNTKYLCRNLGHLAGVSHIDESKMNLPEIRMLAYAAWSIWIGCCITVAGDRNFHRSRLECYGQFAAALGLACVHILQHEVTRIQTSAQPKGILKLENGEK